MKIRTAKTRTACLSAIALATLMSLGDAAWAQRGGGDTGGDRGGSRGGDRGGDRGGSRGGPGMGGPGMGGPGMGGPGMGGPGMGGPGFGGGGFGGPPGGGFGGGGFGGGSFSPIDMLKRFDRNGNNMLDPDEMEGPARFFVDRMAQNNPRIDVNRPIPLDRLAGEMDRMRQERMGGAMPGTPGAPATTAPKEPEPLVPGFDKVEEKPVVQGFGVPDENSSVKVEDRDLREADDRLRRYDTNKDGVLSKEEMANSRWSDDPMQYDRNRDGKLTKNELAVRYAKRRLAEQGGQPGQPGAPNTSNNSSRFAGMSSSWGSRGGDNGSSWGNRGGDNGGGWGNRDAKVEDGKAGDKKEQPASYRSGSTRDKSNATKGLPDWFARSDANNDGQVMMSEYSPNWSPDKVAEFAKFDLNNDGIVTSRECLTSLKNSGKSTTGIVSTVTSTTSTPSSGASIVSKIGETSTEEANKAWAQRQFDKYDKNKDAKLTVDEWSSMIIKPKDGTDANGDGMITVEEFAKSR